MSVALNPNPARASAAPVVGAPVIAAAPTAADKAPTPGPQANAPHFADLLRRSRAEASAPAPAAPVATPSPQDEPADGTDAQDASTIESKTVAGNAAKARAATPKRATGMAAVDNGEHKVEKARSDVDDKSAEGAPSAAASPAGDRGDAQALATAAQTPTRTARSNSEADDAVEPRSARRDAGTGAQGATPAALGHARGMAIVDAAADKRAASSETGRDAALLAGADPSFHAALADAAALPGAAGAPALADRAVDALTASLAAGAATTFAAAAPGADAVATVVLAMPVDAPDFAATLGVQVSLLAHDGVQQAELHLNPAEMGPVSIHISLDGTAARVDFGADVAATREAIERGLPELASALRDAGFTLAGGGVSQHAGGRSGGDDDAARGGRGIAASGAAPAGAAPAGRVVRSVATGGVDLYA